MTLYPQVRLEADGLDTLLIDDSVGIYGQRLDLGDAVTREVAFDAPDADGTVDSTQLIGARNITLSVIVNPDSGLWDLRTRLRAFTAPRLRPYMFVQYAPDAPELRIQMRRSQFTDIIGDGPRPATQADPDVAAITVQWVAPSGVLESAEERVQNVYAAGSGATAGRAYSLTFSRTYPASAPLGSATVVNAGNTNAYPVLRLYGPFTDPVIDNVTQSKSLQFTGLTIGAGSFVQIDMRPGEKTILADADPAVSFYDKLDFPPSEWFTLSPGENQIRFHPATYTEGVTLAQFIYRDAYL